MNFFKTSQEKLETLGITVENKLLNKLFAEWQNNKEIKTEICSYFKSMLIAEKGNVQNFQNRCFYVILIIYINL